MATAGLVAVLTSLLLLKAADGLELQSRRQAGQAAAAALGAPGAHPSLDEWFKRHNSTAVRRSGAPPPSARTPAYTEATALAGYGFCQTPTPQFDESALAAQIPAYGFATFDPFGMAVTDPTYTFAFHMDPDTCATVCEQVSGCSFFSATPATNPINEPCFIYSDCSTPMVSPIPVPFTIYSFVESSGDPHLRNLAGEKFDVNQPDDYLLLRVPREPAKPALLAMRGYVGVAEGAPCALYMKEVTLSGEWLGAKQVQVRSLKGKSFQGTWPNGWPFAMKTTSTGQDSEGQWRAWENFSTTEGSAGETLPGTITVATVFRKEEAAAGRVMEAQAFEFRVGTQTAAERASILVAQGSHEGLDISLSKMTSFHEAELGGLLGTEKHDKKVEARTEACEASRSQPKAKRTMRSAATGSTFTASWV